MLKDCRKSEVTDEEMHQVLDLLEKIQEWKRIGVTCATVLLSWLQRHIQPLQQRTHPASAAEDTFRLLVYWGRGPFLPYPRGARRWASPEDAETGTSRHSYFARRPRLV